MTEFLESLALCSMTWHDIVGPIPRQRVVINVRMFFKLYLVHYFENNLLVQDNPATARAIQVVEFSEASKKLLPQFELLKNSLVSILVPTPRAGSEEIKQFLIHHTQDFIRNILDYETKFRAWKMYDTPIATERIKRQLDLLVMFLCQVSGPHQEFDRTRPIISLLQDKMQQLTKTLGDISGEMEVQAFKNNFRALLFRRRQLRLLREEQQRNTQGPHTTFSFIEA